MDWLVELQATDDGAFLQAMLEVAGEGYLEAPDGTRILCACELVAALTGQGVSELPGIAREWVKQHPVLDVHALLPIDMDGLDRMTSSMGDTSAIPS